MDISILNIKNDLEQNYLKNSGGTIAGDLTVNGDINGNAESASKLETPRTISLTGDVTGSTNFDGSSDISIDTSLSVSEVQTWEATKNDIHIKIVKKGNVCKMQVSTTIESDDVIAKLIQLSDMPDWAKCDFEPNGTIASASSSIGFSKDVSETNFSVTYGLTIHLVKIDSTTYRMTVMGCNSESSSRDVSLTVTYLGNGHNIQLDTESVIDGFPVGSIYVNSTNTSPSWIFGGEWELIDKEFEPYKNSDEGVESIESVENNVGVVCVRQGHNVFIRASYVPTVNLTDGTTVLFTFKQSTFGTKDADIYYPRYFVGQSDGGQGLIEHTITSALVCQSVDVLTKSAGNIPSGSACSVVFNWEIPWDYMDDSYCNKFYWKRIS